MGRTMNGLHFLQISFLLEKNIRLIAMYLQGETLGFPDISRFPIPIISWTTEGKNLDFIPLESPCDSKQNKPSPDFKSPFPNYDPKTNSWKKGYFGAVEWEIAC
jgi:hypothetical protein